MLMPMVWTNDFDDMMDDFADDWYDPFEDVVSLVAPDKEEIQTEKSIDRHNRKLANRYNKMLRHEWNGMNRLMKKNLMKTDVVDHGDHFTLTADLPGFDKKDISIGLKDGILSVSASHKEDKDEKDTKTGKFIRKERTEASYERSFEVGEDVKPEEIAAKYENGVLTLTVPNKAAIAEKAPAKQIEIK
ncbi:MAG: Hsp20/alpha crystallin family protein [Lachnospiraceae bacterium]|nr:Hsp20/alpha crystallin family protein [Lachnospiraceae bacterium]